MQSLPPFGIHTPASLPEACQTLATLGTDAAAYAGGTELLLAMKLGALRYEHLVDLKGIDDLNRISVSSDGASLDVGATATYADLVRSPEVQHVLPGLVEVVDGIGNIRVRASGTMAGNIAFADPHSDITTIGLCLDMSCEVVTQDGTTWQRLDDLVVGPYETILNPGHLLSRVRFPLQPNRVVRYRRFRVHERPTVAVAVSAVISDRMVTEARVVVGGAVPVATRSAQAEALLAGGLATIGRRAGEVADAAVADLDIIDDEEGSARYKRHLVRTFVNRLAQSLGQSTDSSTS